MKLTRLACLVALTAAALALPTPVRADDALRAGVLDLLSGYESGPTAESLRALGPDVGAELYALATDPAVPSTRRIRAVYALGWFQTATTRAWLRTTLADRAAESQVRRSAGWALANGWGEAALPELTVALTDPDDQLRAQVVRAIAKVGTAPALDALRARQLAESEPMVARTLTDALAGK